MSGRVCNGGTVHVRRLLVTTFAVLPLSLVALGCAGKTAEGVANIAELRAEKTCACKSFKCVTAIEKKYEDKLDDITKISDDERKRALAAISKAIDCDMRAGGIGQPSMAPR